MLTDLQPPVSVHTYVYTPKHTYKNVKLKIK